MNPDLALGLLFLVAAMLYASVGHAGASAYLAAMALVGVDPAVMRPTALVLNVAVASLVTFQFWRAGYVQFRAVLPFVAGSIPLSFIGGLIILDPTIYKPLVGIVLLLAAARFLIRPSAGTAEGPVHAPVVLAVVIGAGIGLLAGLTGTGGGIFLTPVLLIAGWAGTRHAAGTSAAFILATSTSGLIAQLQRGVTLPEAMPWWVAATLVGALIGSQLGATRLSSPRLRQALGVVLVIAGLKLIYFG